MDIKDIPVGAVVEMAANAWAYNLVPMGSRGVVVKKTNDAYYFDLTVAFKPKHGGPMRTLTVNDEAYGRSRNIPVTVVEGAEAKEILDAYKAHRRNSHISIIGAGPGTINLGTDPEVFVLGHGGRVLPADMFLPEKKRAKNEKAPYSGGGGMAAAFWDGYQAECTTSTHSCLGWLTDAVQHGLTIINREAKKVDPKAKLTTKTGIELTNEELMEAPESRVMLGCSPSKNIYGDQPLNQDDARLNPHRFTGAHMHWGVGKRTPETVEKIVKALDRMAGVCLVGLCQGREHPLRRRFYGRAGEYRLPAHGIEWRVPSSAILASPGVWHLAWNISRQAVRLVLNNLDDIWECDQDRAVEIINYLDVKGAREVIEHNRPVVMDLLDAYVGGSGAGRVGYAMLMDGMGVGIDKPDDLTGNWFLEGGWRSHCGVPNGTFASLTSRFIQTHPRLYAAMAPVPAMA